MEEITNREFYNHGHNKLLRLRALHTLAMAWPSRTPITAILCPAPNYVTC
jgi:hypothetical protein